MRKSERGFLRAPRGTRKSGDEIREAIVDRFRTNQNSLSLSLSPSSSFVLSRHTYVDQIFVSFSIFDFLVLHLFLKKIVVTMERKTCDYVICVFKIGITLTKRNA